MSYTYTKLLIVNKAFGKFGGAGDQYGATGMMTQAALDADEEKVAVFTNDVYPQVRRQVIIDLAKAGCPFKESAEYVDLGTELKQYDEVISDIVSSGGTVTVTTDEEHEFSTGDKICILGVRGTLAMETTLNNSVYTITKVDSTSFTLNSLTGTDSWEYTEDSGIVSYCPETGGYGYAFNLPDDCEFVVRQIDEDFSDIEEKRKEYRFDTIMNRDRDDKLLITNNICNHAGDSAFIEYVHDLEDEESIFSDDFVQCFATLLAAELAPFCGRDMQVRQQMLLEYQQLVRPAAKVFNQSQFNRRAKTVPNYFGGRS